MHGARDDMLNPTIRNSNSLDLLPANALRAGFFGLSFCIIKTSFLGMSQIKFNVPL